MASPTAFECKGSSMLVKRDGAVISLVAGNNDKLHLARYNIATNKLDIAYSVPGFHQ